MQYCECLLPATTHHVRAHEPPGLACGCADLLCSTMSPGACTACIAEHTACMQPAAVKTLEEAEVQTTCLLSSSTVGPEKCASHLLLVRRLRSCCTGSRSLSLSRASGSCLGNAAAAAAASAALCFARMALLAALTSAGVAAAKS